MGLIILERALYEREDLAYFHLDGLCLRLVTIVVENFDWPKERHKNREAH